MFGKKKREQAVNLMQTGARGIGTVLNVQDTGMTMNEDPRVKVTMRVEPIDGSPPFEASKTRFVSRVEIPRMGDRYPVWYDASDSDSWAWAQVQDDNGRAQLRQMFGPRVDTCTGFGGGGAAPAAPPAPAADPLDRLKKLDELRTAGVLTDAEFAAKKAELLAEI